jgi:hypothetical protein
MFKKINYFDINISKRFENIKKFEVKKINFFKNIFKSQKQTGF